MQRLVDIEDLKKDLFAYLDSHHNKIDKAKVVTVLERQPMFYIDFKKIDETNDNPVNSSLDCMSR